MSRDQNPVPQAVADHWDRLLDDTRATAEEYRDRGWDVLVLHTADATILDGESFGLDVLVPDNEYDDLLALTEEASFDASRAFHTEESGVRFLLVVVEAAGTEQAVAIPAYVPVADEPPLRQRAEDEGLLYTHVRSLSSDSRVTFTHEDPTLFF